MNFKRLNNKFMNNYYHHNEEKAIKSLEHLNRMNDDKLTNIIIQCNGKSWFTLEDFKQLRLKQKEIDDSSKFRNTMKKQKNISTGT